MQCAVCLSSADGRNDLCPTIKLHAKQQARLNINTRKKIACFSLVLNFILKTSKLRILGNTVQNMTVFPSLIISQERSLWNMTLVYLWIQHVRILDMSHGLVQQTKEKSRWVFGIVKERILTTQLCSVIEEVQQGGQCGAALSLCGPKILKVQYRMKLIY